MKHKRRALLATLAALCILATGCMQSLPIRTQQQATMPPPPLADQIPSGDAAQEQAETILLSLPSRAGAQLINISEKVLMPPNRHPAETTLRKLLSFTGNDQALPIFARGQLQLAPGSDVLLSGDTATVDLGPAALALEPRQLYAVSRSIASTLSQWGDIRYINVLVNGIQPGLDAAASMPVGALTQTRNDDPGQSWESLNAQRSAAGDTPENQRFSSIATLYFPAAAGRGILAEARTISFEGRTPPMMVATLLETLGADAQLLPGLPAVPNLLQMLREVPAVEDQPQAGGRVVRLRFVEQFNQALIEQGIPRSVMLASLTYTLTTFIPGTVGLQVEIGAEKITNVVPSGIYEGAGQTIQFADGIMRRRDFAQFLLTYCTLYFANPERGLSAVRRPIPYYQAQNVRYLLNQLMAGPQNADNVQGLSPTLPQALNEAALIGTAKAADAVLLNFSQALLDDAKGMDIQAEQRMVYSIVNTLTQLRQVRRVQFYINGRQPDTFAGALYLPGEFLRNTEIIHSSN